MKILESLSNMLTLDLRRAAADPGVYVSRPVFNKKPWLDWAAAHKIPNPTQDLHVTVIYSSVDAKIPIDDCPIIIPTRNAAFCMFGPDEDSLVVAFDSWQLWDRNWAYIAAGAVSQWPTYRPHMTISGDAAGFSLPDEALADVPEYIVLDGEVRALPKVKAPADEMDPEGADEGDDATLIIVLEIAAAAAKAKVEKGIENPIDMVAMRDIAAKKPITRAVAKRLAATDWAPPEIKAIVEEKKAAIVTAPAVDPDRPGLFKDVEFKVSPVVKDKNGKAREIRKADDDRQLIWGIASVSTVNGELVKDYHGDTITTRALEEFAIDLVRGQRMGDFDHDFEPSNEIVQALVLSDELQKALGFDLGYEPLVICTHVPDAALWNEVKTGEWEHSIAGRFQYFETEAATA